MSVITNATNVASTTETNNEGIYPIPSVPPGKYHIRVSKNGFKNMVKPDVIVHVQDAPTLNFTLELGAADESVTCGSRSAASEHAGRVFRSFGVLRHSSQLFLFEVKTKARFFWISVGRIGLNRGNPQRLVPVGMVNKDVNR